MQRSLPERTDPRLPAVLPIAAVLAEMPGVAERLLAGHYPDANGYCHGCRLPQAGYSKWPCSLATNARQARELQEAVRSARGTLRRRPRQLGSGQRTEVGR